MIFFTDYHVETSLNPWISFYKGSALQSMDSVDQRRYIDPGNYLDLLELLSTFTSELERSKTKLEGLIGQGKENIESIRNHVRGNLSWLFVDNNSFLGFSGEFADVYKGTLKTKDGKNVVAVKVLRVSFWIVLWKICLNKLSLFPSPVLAIYSRIFTVKWITFKDPSIY